MNGQSWHETTGRSNTAMWPHEARAHHEVREKWSSQLSMLRKRQQTFIATTVTNTGLRQEVWFNPLNVELNPICHLLALLGGATIVVVSRLRVNIILTYLNVYWMWKVIKITSARTEHCIQTAVPRLNFNISGVELRLTYWLGSTTQQCCNGTNKPFDSRFQFSAANVALVGCYTARVESKLPAVQENTSIPPTNITKDFSWAC